jgi:hypothetical protein
MAIGQAPTQQKFEDAALLLGDRLEEGSIYKLLADEGQQLFPDDYFADLYSDSVRGRPTVPARVVATTMLLQAHEGLSDREARDHIGFDLRWQAAAGLPAAYEGFDHSVLCGMRNRLRASDRPKRLFEDTVVRAKKKGRISRRVRVVDSTPLFDAVATQDTVTQVRSAIRRVLRSAPADVAARVRQALERDDTYEHPGKPPCDWDDPAAREALVDELVRDALAALEVLHGVELSGQAKDDAELLSLVAGQDVSESEDGRFRIVRGVARDRLISTVDPQARHGHKSHARHFDGYKTHMASDPDSEIITEVAVTPANTPDREVVDELIADLSDDAVDEDGSAEPSSGPVVVGDSAYADAATRSRLEARGVEVMAKVPPVRNAHGGFSKDRFTIDLDQGTVTCPARNTVPIVERKDGSGIARFGSLCAPCPLREACTTARVGRSVAINRHERILQQARTEQRGDDWKQRYRQHRPIAERTMARFTRRWWGGRKARCRGTARILTDVLTRAAALNLARMARLEVGPSPQPA